MNSVMIGFVLLFSPCGKDACEWVRYQQIQACEQAADELKMRRPQYEFTCGDAYRDEK